MDRRHVRAVYRWTDGEDTTITFDLALSEDRIEQRAVFLGFTGKFPASFYPFVLLLDGRIDYGCDYTDDAVRYIRTNVRERLVRLGELMTTHEKDDNGRFKEWTYRCIRLDPV